MQNKEEIATEPTEPSTPEERELEEIDESGLDEIVGGVLRKIGG